MPLYSIMLNWSPEQLIAAILMLAQEVHATPRQQIEGQQQVQDQDTPMLCAFAFARLTSITPGLSPNACQLS